MLRVSSRGRGCSSQARHAHPGSVLHCSLPPCSLQAVPSVVKAVAESPLKLSPRAEGQEVLVPIPRCAAPGGGLWGKEGRAWKHTQKFVVSATCSASMCAVRSMPCPLPACRPTIETIAAMMKVHRGLVPDARGCHAATDCRVVVVPLPGADCCCRCLLLQLPGADSLCRSPLPPSPSPPRWPRLRASRQKCRCGTSASWPWTQPRSWPARTSASGWRRRCSGSQTTTSRRYEWGAGAGEQGAAVHFLHASRSMMVGPPAASPIPQIDGMVAKKEKSIKMHDS